MKKKILMIGSLITVFFLGMTSNYFLLKYFPIVIDENISKTKTVKEIQVEEKAFTDAINSIYDAVVVVDSQKSQRSIGSGTGFIYKKDTNYGYIVTNAHVIEGADNVVVTFSNNNNVNAKILGKDVYADIAVLSVPVKEILKVATIGRSELSSIGNTVFTVGAPLGSDYSGTVTKGILSGKDRMVSMSIGGTTNDWIMKVLQTDAAINPGNSGGPLVNLAGEVIGITSLKLVQSEVEGMGFAIPIEDAMSYAKILETGEAIPRPVIGIQLLDLNEKYYLYLSSIYLPEDVVEGVVVQAVLEGYPAAQSGLKKGDVITKINNKNVLSKAELRYELFRYKAGDTIKITYLRDSKIGNVDIKLADEQEKE